MLSVAQSLPVMDPDELQAVVDGVCTTYDVDVCTIYVHEPEHRVLVLAATHGLSDAAIGAAIPLTRGLTGKVARTHHPVSVKHPAQHEEYYFVEGSGEETLESYLGLPILRFGDLLGVMVVQTFSPRVFRLSEIEAFYDTGKSLIEKLQPPSSGGYGRR